MHLNCLGREFRHLLWASLVCADVGCLALIRRKKLIQMSQLHLIKHPPSGQNAMQLLMQVPCLVDMHLHLAHFFTHMHVINTHQGFNAILCWSVKLFIYRFHTSSSLPCSKTIPKSQLSFHCLPLLLMHFALKPLIINSLCNLCNPMLCIFPFVLCNLCFFSKSATFLECLVQCKQLMLSDSVPREAHKYPNRQLWKDYWVPSAAFLLCLFLD